MDLFESAHHSASVLSAPLAEILRPKKIEEMLGQPKVLGEKSPWLKLIDSGQIPSLILWGPPGTGKTTFALLLASKIDAEFFTVNAVEIGAKALRELGDQGRTRRLQYQRKTVVFIDEIHRLNKGQQDVLLPFVEKGEIILVGATTENPSYEINSALLSRCRLLVFERLSSEDLLKLATRAARAAGFGLSDLLSKDASELLLALADGDGRKLLNSMEILLQLRSGSDASSDWPLPAERFSEVLEFRPLRYDKNSDQHFDTVSAFIKSVRGSDPDASLYYLARMLKGGEDPKFIARRLVILASEDIGNADPRALQVAISGFKAVEIIGLPEAAISLAQVTTYLASAPKSNRAYLGLKKAQELVEKTGALPIPLALRSAKTALMKGLGYGKDYRYSHEGIKGFVSQRFLPSELDEVRLYEPTDHGFEKNIRQYLEWLKQ